VKFRDECTRFFHANATTKHKRRSICSLLDPTGVSLTTHDDKATLLWESFKERLGKSECTHMHFDLDNLVNPVQGFGLAA
jgi:hypothetical protein